MGLLGIIFCYKNESELKSLDLMKTVEFYVYEFYFVNYNKTGKNKENSLTYIEFTLLDKCYMSKIFLKKNLKF